MDLKKFEMENKVISALRQVYDPEIPVNIYDLGLIYDLRLDDSFNVNVLMTLTTPNCPVAEDMPGMVKSEIKLIEGIGEVNVELTFEPPWDMEKLTDEAKLELGML
ncbi:MAG: SUF system Fe-S cluster assembly protein [Bacteroidales bacterium]|nr:SUF system Fe-S cluster assembly protein [Bacteroidales bacterium]